MPTPDYEQPNSSQYVIDGASFFRLKQYLASSGDIFESEASAHAFALGPDSDISRVKVAYFDPQAGGSPHIGTSSSLQSILTLSPANPFAASIAALNTTARYAPSGVPARILMWCDEKYDDQYLPAGFNAGNDRLVFEPPVIDVIEFFAPPAEVSSIRADKEFYYNSLPGAADDAYLLVPFYGRRYATIVIQNNTVVDLTTTISGVDFQINDTVPASEVVLLGGGFLQAAGVTTSKILRAAVDGLHDYLLLQFSPTGGGGGADVSCKIVLSDTPD